MKEIKASFVIPAYNAQRFLAQTILSCRAQSVKDIEIIVVNDGSTDGTRELVEWHERQDDRVKGINLEKNEGRSAARNVGNALAKSPFILVLDADDLACRHRVRDTLLTFQMKNPDVVYGPFQLLDDLGNGQGKVPAGPFNKEISIQKKMNFICHSTMAYRKGVTMNVKYDEGDYSWLGLDDWKFQLDCVIKGYKFAVTSTILSQYRHSANNTEARRDPKEVERLKDAYFDQNKDQLALAK